MVRWSLAVWYDDHGVVVEVGHCTVTGMAFHFHKLIRKLRGELDDPAFLVQPVMYAAHAIDEHTIIIGSAFII